VCVCVSCVCVSVVAVTVSNVCVVLFVTVMLVCNVLWLTAYSVCSGVVEVDDLNGLAYQFNTIAIIITSLQHHCTS
jgi:hypothetical protein